MRPQRIYRGFLFNKNNMEIWKDIPNYEGLYQVSNMGRVKSLIKEWNTYTDRLVKRKERISNGHKGKGDYLCFVLLKNNKSKHFKVHQLVAMSFLNHVPCGHDKVVDHINGIKTDNRLENLQVITHIENVCRVQKSKECTSKHRGVCKRKGVKKWNAYIGINKKRIHLGYFVNELDAVKARELALENYLKTINTQQSLF